MIARRGSNAQPPEHKLAFFMANCGITTELAYSKDLAHKSSAIRTQHSLEIPRCETPWYTHSQDKKTQGWFGRLRAGDAFATARQKCIRP